MLIVDLGRLEREGRVRLRAEPGPDDPIWSGMDFRWAEPVRIELEAQQVRRGARARRTFLD